MGLLLVIGVVVLGVVGGVIFLLSKNTSSHKKTDVKLSTPQQEASQILTKINSFYDLPAGETPTIATVSDKTKLQGQPFFAKAENGDKVLIYTNAKKALLYRPSINKLMEVSSLALSSPAPTPSGTPPPTTPETKKTVTVSIYNGTKIAGLASNTEKKLTEKYDTIKVIEKDNAIKNYSKTVVVDINGNNADMAKNIAAFLDGSVSSLPQGEKKSEGEILVIMGK